MLKVKVKTKEGYEVKKAYYVEELELKGNLTIELGKHGKRYVKEPAYFDTETSHIDERTQWIYQWAFLWGRLCVVGRTVSQFILLMKMIIDVYNLGGDRRLLVFVHNLGYDWSNIESFLVEQFETEKEFLTDVHKPLSCCYSGVEFRCTCRLSGYGLDKFSQVYAKKYVKAVGAIDYNKIRYPDDPLEEVDWEYMLSDVYSQQDATENYIKSMGVSSIFFSELTKTGFVRRDYRKASRKAKGWRKRFTEDYRLSYGELELMKEAFMGGYVHGNRFYSSMTIRKPIGHRDFGSSYPDKMMKRYVPGGSLNLFAEVAKLEEVRPLLDNYCVITRIAFQGLRLKKGKTMPYISAHKCRVFKKRETIEDNGKILCSDYLETTLTEIDFHIIEDLYTWDYVTFFDTYYCTRMLLPEWFRETCFSYYKEKTKLKGVEAAAVQYEVSKENLNSGYGMCATYPVHNEIIRTGSDFTEVKPEDAEEALNQFYENKSSFLPYQWGVYITAHARAELFKCINLLDPADVIYCDTDSIFYISTPENEAIFEYYNKTVIEECESLGLVAADQKGKPHYLGEFEEEKEGITAFRFLHSKCYAFEGKKGLKITVAGVTADVRIWNNEESFLLKREEELGSIDNLSEGFIFEKCGGNRAVYVQRPNEVLTINGHMVEVGNACIILPVQKELSTLPEVDPDTGLPFIFKTF